MIRHRISNLKSSIDFSGFLTQAPPERFAEASQVGNDNQPIRLWPYKKNATRPDWTTTKYCLFGLKQLTALTQRA
jgi:hypothetical protein